ncbi:porin family protein [Maridesulfovibrio frigidus]|uniref:hypothetical protein n=1 Tax=Maridesulfovibrio frigidus TaxID=340956 RepID=UPI0004E0B750|nr:hypothetical protein [Maridesulfovibrio frigidus]
MLNFALRVMRILVFSVLLIPVCGVLAEQEESSWRVRMPVIQPVEIVEKRAKLVQVAELDNHVSEPKRPVAKVVLRAESVENVVDEGPVYKAVFDKEAPRETALTDVESYYVLAEADVADTDNVKALSTDSNNADPNIANDVEDGSAQGTYVAGSVNDPLAASSVSIMPDGNAAAKQQRAAQDVSFFTTPKRAAGLSGTVVKAKPSISVIETYDSNVDYKDIEDLVTEIKPALTFDVIGQDGSFKFRGDFIYRTYLNNKDLDRYDYNLSMSGKYKFSPKVDGEVRLTHNRRHNLDQNTFEAGGVTLDPTIILTTIFNPQINWRVGERDNINFALNTDKTDYERAVDSDYLSNVLSGVWGHALRDERTTLFLGAMNTYTHFSREIDSLQGDQVSFQGVLGIDYQFTSALSLSFKGGPGVTVSNYSSDETTGDDVDLLYQFRFELGYRELEFSIVPAIERIVRPGRYGENEVLDQAELYYRYEFSEYLTYDMINTYWMIESEGVLAGRKHKSSGIFTQSVLNWVFEEDWKASFAFSYNYGQNEISHKTNERAKTWVGLTYSFPTEIN